MNNINEIIGEKDVITCEKREDGAEILRISNPSGEGVMTWITVCDGVEVTYNDFHMDCCFSGYETRNRRLLCFDHCREGRIEHNSDELYYYFERGDLLIDDRRTVASHKCYSFPLAHFHGMTICIDIDKAKQSLAHEISDYGLKLESLYERSFTQLSEDQPVRVLRKNPMVEHIFSELYHLPSAIKKQYLKLKVIELLMLLSLPEMLEHNHKFTYFHRVQVEKVKAIREKLVTNLENNYTLQELSEQFDISLTQMKNCFKQIYGTPIVTYIRNYKINYAAGLLRDGKLSVTEIALAVGYENPSKFSEAFKTVMGKTPTDYKKSIV